MTFRLISTSLNPDGLGAVEYEASFWEGPVESGQVGRRVTRRCRDVVMWRWKDMEVVGRTFLNTSPSVSYYSELARSVRLDRPLPSSRPRSPLCELFMESANRR